VFGQEQKNPLEDIESSAFIQTLSKWWVSEERDLEQTALEASHSNYQLPSWANGQYWTSGVSKFEFGTREFTDVMDGMGRYTRYDIKNGQVSVRSKMLDSKWYELCKSKNDILPNVLFSPPNPKPWNSNVPGVNIYYASHYGDNMWVQMHRMPDKKTYFGATDQDLRLQIDPDTLKQQGFIQYQDDKGVCPTGGNGPTHMQTRPTNGDMINLCAGIDTSSGKNRITVYSISADNVLKRNKIADIPTTKMRYIHSFRITPDYAIIFEHPMYIDAMKLMAGYDMVEGAMAKEKDGTTKIHIVHLDTGDVKTIETGDYFVTLHQGNTFMKDDNTIIADVAGYWDAEKDPLYIWQKDNFKAEETALDMGSYSKLTRMTLHLDTLKVEYDHLLEEGKRTYDLPRYNPTYDGVKENCFTYVMELVTPSVYDDPETDFHWPVTKYDNCQKKVAAQWSEAGILPMEVRFVPDPHGRHEDDGVLLTQYYNFLLQKTYFTAVDPKTMKRLQDWELPFKIPIGFHTQYYPDEPSL
jgi:carotenoid cleavage dioxygenase-like enzyme